MSKETKKSEIQLNPITPAQIAVPDALPEWLRQDIGNKAGFELADKEDFTLPRLAICQSLSPQRKKSNPAYIEGLEEGDFFNTLTGRIYGKKITVVPLFFTRNRIKFLEPIGSGIDCQSINGKDGGRLHPSGCRSCEFSQWGEDGPACTEFKNIVLLVRDEAETGGISSPLLFSNKSTAITVVKQWNAVMNMTNLPMFAGIYELNTATTVKNNNEYFTWNFSRCGWVPQQIYSAAQNFFESLHDKDISFNVDEMSQEEAATGAGATANTEM
jgi:hypothetical protein